MLTMNLVCVGGMWSTDYGAACNIEGALSLVLDWKDTWLLE